MSRDTQDDLPKNMGPESKRPGSITFLLVGLVLLVTVAGLFVAFVPVVLCPECKGEPFAGWTNGHDPDSSRCWDRYRITILNRWQKGLGTR